MWNPSRLYAQNFEDLYLQRIFSGIDNGFYIDAGAWHPTVDNVTAIFYQRGWRGVNIEPVEEIFNILNSERPQDVNLCLAVVGSSDPHTASLLIVSDDPTISGQHHLELADPVDQSSFGNSSGNAFARRVPTSTLREIVERYAASQQVHFLKLDVEGYEYNALIGLDIRSLLPHQRPQVILFEATIPDTRLSAPHRDLCRDYLLGNSYKFLFCDGLNDYYCLEDLHARFSPVMLPPNVFDRPSISGGQIFALFDKYEDLARDSANSLRLIADSQDQRNALERELENMKLEKDGLERELGNVRAEKDEFERDLADAREESELLLLQLRLVQEELENYYLQSGDLLKETHRKDEKLNWLRDQRELLLRMLTLQGSLQQQFITLDARTALPSMLRRVIPWWRRYRVS